MSRMSRTPPTSGAGSRQQPGSKPKTNDGAGEMSELAAEFSEILSPSPSADLAAWSGGNANGPPNFGGGNGEIANQEEADAFMDNFFSDDSDAEEEGKVDEEEGKVEEEEGKVEEEEGKLEEVEEEKKEEDGEEDGGLAVAVEAGVGREPSALRRSSRVAARVPALRDTANAGAEEGQLPDGAEGGAVVVVGPLIEGLAGIFDNTGNKLVILDKKGGAIPVMAKLDPSDAAPFAYARRIRLLAGVCGLSTGWFWARDDFATRDDNGLAGGAGGIPPEGTRLNLGDNIRNMAGDHVSEIYVYHQPRLAIENGILVENASGDLVRDNSIVPSIGPFFSVYSSADQAARNRKSKTIVVMHGRQEAGVLTVTGRALLVPQLLHVKATDVSGTATLTIPHTDEETGKPMKVKVRNSKADDGPERMTQAGSEALPRPYLWMPSDLYPKKENRKKAVTLRMVAKASANYIAGELGMHPLVGRDAASVIGKFLEQMNCHEATGAFE